MNETTSRGDMSKTTSAAWKKLDEKIRDRRWC